MDGTNLGSRVKELRAEAGLTLQQVADRAGCTKSYIWEIENGRSVNPTIKQVTRLCRAFGLPITEFINGNSIHGSEYALTVGSDAMRVCIGLLPVTHSIDDIVSWIRSQGKK